MCFFFRCIRGLYNFDSIRSVFHHNSVPWFGNILFVSCLFMINNTIDYLVYWLLLFSWLSFSLLSLHVFVTYSQTKCIIGETKNKQSRNKNEPLVHAILSTKNVMRLLDIFFYYHPPILALILLHRSLSV